MDKSQIEHLWPSIKLFFVSHEEKAKELPGLGYFINKDGSGGFKSLCCYCPAAVWRLKRNRAHISLYCKVLSSEYEDGDIELIEVCNGYDQAVEEAKMLADDD